MVPTRFWRPASFYLLHPCSRAGADSVVTTIYFAHTKKPRDCEALMINGADCRSRTGDLLITSQLLYQLS